MIPERHPENRPDTQSGTTNPSLPQPRVSLKHRMILALIPLATGLVSLIGLTLRLRLIDPNRLAPQAKPYPALIYAFWHNQQLLAAYVFRHFGIRVLVSRSQDGDYIAAVLKRFGFGTVRSSTSSGKVNALRGLTRELRAGHPAAITPDGPRGPVYQAQPGAIFLSSLSGHAVAPFACALERAWTLKSWDRFQIPRPFSRAVIVFGEPLSVPRKLDETAAQEWLNRLQDQLETLRHRAEDACRSDNPR